MSDPFVFTASDLPVPDPDDWANNIVPPECPGGCGDDVLHCHCYGLGHADGTRADLDAIVQGTLLIVAERIAQLKAEGGDVLASWLIEHVPDWTSIADDLRAIEEANSGE